MTPSERFSSRRGFRPTPREITVREDAPAELRDAVIQIARDFGFDPHDQRAILCRLLRALPDGNNWSAYPNVWGEVQDLIGGCEWFHVYDYIEALYQALLQRDPDRVSALSEEINQFFISNGIGWQLLDGHIEIRGPESFETALAQARDVTEAGLPVANREVQEALHDLSRRPTPDLTGAIQHALAALECVAREVTGDANATLGAILSRYPDLLPKPLDMAAEKIWGFASERGRHLRERQELPHPDVELIVGLSAQLVTFLVRTLGTKPRAV
jgi:hypothetical protein